MVNKTSRGARSRRRILVPVYTEKYYPQDFETKEVTYDNYLLLICSLVVYTDIANTTFRSLQLRVVDVEFAPILN